MNKEDQDILFFAFRYALGRKTGAVGFMVDAIIRRWDKIDEKNKVQMKNEIAHAISLDMAGQDCDVQEWNRVMAL